ncbi:hypothetical protein [Nocardia sp. NPDC059239]|uniref:hypothetical protein n=1 Tax=Nocardia sp. NPDC059239 TaxID=3346785 RepID=UPI0036D1BFC1
MPGKQARPVRDGGGNAPPLSDDSVFKWMHKRGTVKWQVYTFVANKPVLALKRKIRAFAPEVFASGVQVALVRINQVQRGWANYFKHTFA